LEGSSRLLHQEGSAEPLSCGEDGKLSEKLVSQQGLLWIGVAWGLLKKNKKIEKNFQCREFSIAAFLTVHIHDKKDHGCTFMVKRQ
jgi:hypothetical protein